MAEKLVKLKQLLDKEFEKETYVSVKEYYQNYIFRYDKRGTESILYILEG